MPLDHLLKHLHHLIVGALNQLLGRLDVVHDVLADQTMDHERLKQLDRHLLGQAALVHLELGTHHNHGTAGIIHPFAEQVLAETPLLALDDVAERLEGAVVGPHHGAASAAVVDQGIDGFLEHALFIAHDDLGGQDLLQSSEAVVAIDHPPVQVVEVARGEATAIQLHHRPQIRWNHRDHIQNHPLGTGIGGDEVINNPQTLDQLGPLLPLAGVDVLAELFADLIEV